MKAISGREFARLIERHGWRLLRVTGIITSTASPEASCIFPFQFTAIARSKPDYCSIC